MAKTFVKLSLAAKLRILFGAAVLGIIAAALVVPWYFMELLAEREVERPAAAVTRLRLEEWIGQHREDHVAASKDENSKIVAYYAAEGQEEGRRGPSFIRLTPGREQELDSPARRAAEVFERSKLQPLAIIPAEDQTGRPVYRCFRAVRVEPMCADCHRGEAGRALPGQAGELVGMIDVTMPASAASGSLVWWTRGAIVVGAALAALLAFFLFVIITQRLILRPVRQLRDVADNVAEGDLTVRSTIRTGDELERLGASFNEMLAAITDQHNKLRAANRALDLKLNELSEVNVALYQANQVKSEFLTNVSHELRTPLNSIIGFADLLAEAADQRAQRYVQNISAAAKTLLTMINDLLDLAKIEAGRAEVRIGRVAVTDTCQTLVTLMKPLADKKQLDLRLELAEDIPLVRTDAGKLQQILYNLLSNAVKFTPAGGRVTVRAGLEEHQRSGRTVREVCVSIIDTGPGVAEADQQHVFEKFYQLDRTLTKASGGTGLGLAIARELTELLGGRLTLKSSPGHGAEFTVHLPVEGPPADGEAEAKDIADARRN
jgi:signal transduction histidine kinase